MRYQLKPIGNGCKFLMLLMLIVNPVTGWGGTTNSFLPDRDTLRNLEEGERWLGFSTVPSKQQQRLINKEQSPSKAQNRSVKSNQPSSKPSSADKMKIYEAGKFINLGFRDFQESFKSGGSGGGADTFSSKPSSRRDRESGPGSGQPGLPPQGGKNGAQNWMPQSEQTQADRTNSEFNSDASKANSEMLINNLFNDATYDSFESHDTIANTNLNFFNESLLES